MKTIITTTTTSKKIVIFDHGELNMNVEKKNAFVMGALASIDL